MSDSEEESSSGADWPVTEEWLQAVLKSHHVDLPDPSSITVLDFTVRPGCDAGESVLSDILAVAVKYRLPDDPADEKHSLSFIVKLLPQDPFSRFFVTEAQFDLREIKFYTQVVPDLENFKSKNLAKETQLELPIPKCYYAHYNAGATEPEPTPPESVLVLENIKPHGYVGADFSRGLTLPQTAAAVESIAQVHALSLSLKVKEGKPLSERYPFLFQTTRASDSYQQLVERGLPQLSQFLEKKTGLENVLEALNMLRSNTKDIIESLLKPEEPMALITHTDFWCNNLMFKEEKDKGKATCCILDWQMVTYSRPTNDLALLLISSVPAELRRLHSDELLDGYWDTLTASCAKLGLNVETELNYDRKNLGEDYKRSQLLALLLCIGSVDVALGDPLTEGRLLELLRDLHNDGLLSTDIINKEQE
ncbi:phosphotransferase [Oryctes borbonicus]|uniref:Phosphotransferase n=1 Tax=Oryctes borbonicus TaxID=1629725 RepID=A0A0T6B7R2_9SCAR|nr:phosphotransferase [Oryctes borbonicus]